MSEQDARNRSQEYYESAEPPEESNLPWLDESDIIAHEYDSDDPWVDEG